MQDFEDLILISDVDEIPNLEEINLEKFERKNFNVSTRHVLLQI